ncbi:MAG: divalent-cation tolerance protein CutA [Solirubrobacterales bacterium]
MAAYVQVLTTTSSEEEAERIASMLLEKRLAACVQTVGPIVSRYRWRDKLERANEWQCLAKTETALYEQVEGAIRDVHSYGEPEILAIPVLAGSKGYLDWVSASVDASHD